MAALAQCILLVALTAAPPPPSSTRPASDPADPKAQSADFWQEVRALTISEQFRDVESRAGPASVVTKSIAEGHASNSQPIANISASRTQASQLIEVGSRKAVDADLKAAVSMVATMTTTPELRAAVVASMPASDRRAAATFSANLSSGIVGLPGVYLNASPSAPSAAPQGYHPVGGGSVGCPSR
jgi:hypothetical protein